MSGDILRRVRFAPYCRGMGPRFALTLWHAGHCSHNGRDRLGYRLRLIPDVSGARALAHEHAEKMGCDTGRFGGHAELCRCFSHALRVAEAERERSRTVFEGEDFSPSPLHAIDSDEAVAALMGFLTLRPGDTDREYFAEYTPEQLEFADQHAEALACEVGVRFDGGER